MGRGRRWNPHGRKTYLEAKAAEHHVHGKEIAFGLAGDASGTTHVAAEIGKSNGTTFTETAFTLTAGNDDFGTPVLLLGSAETVLWPSNALEFDCHRFTPVATNADKEWWFLRFIWGMGSSADAITAGQYTVQPIFLENVDKRSDPIELMMEKIAVDTFLWAQIFCLGQNAKTLSIYPSLHTYSFVS